jgi:hypothetical protein
LDPVFVVGGNSVSLLALFHDSHTRVGEELEGGTDLPGARDVVGVFHAHDDPPDVLRRFHGAVGTFEGLDDREESLSSIDTFLQVLIEEIEPVVLESPRACQESHYLLGRDSILISTIEKVDKVVDGDGS